MFVLLAPRPQRHLRRFKHRVGGYLRRRQWTRRVNELIPELRRLCPRHTNRQICVMAEERASFELMAAQRCWLPTTGLDQHRTFLVKCGFVIHETVGAMTHVSFPRGWRVVPALHIRQGLDAAFGHLVDPAGASRLGISYSHAPSAGRTTRASISSTWY